MLPGPAKVRTSCFHFSGDMLSAKSLFRAKERRRRSRIGWFIRRWSSFHSTTSRSSMLTPGPRRPKPSNASISLWELRNITPCEACWKVTRALPLASILISCRGPSWTRVVMNWMISLVSLPLTRRTAALVSGISGDMEDASVTPDTPRPCMSLSLSSLFWLYFDAEKPVIDTGDIYCAIS